MSTEAQTTDTGSNAVESKEPVAKPVEAKQPVAAAKPVEPKPVAESRTTTARKIGADDELPDDADLLELTPRALASRITRATKKELKDRFGTDDVDEVKAKLARLEEMEAKEEARTLAEMSEKERLEAELARERDRASQAETRLSRAEEARVVESTEKKVMEIATKYIDEDYKDEVLSMLKRDMRANWDDSELENETKAYKKMEVFFKELIEKKPKLGKDFQVTQEVKTSPLSSGVPNTRPQGAAQNLNGVKSGGEKSVKEMSKTEYIAWKRSRGYSA